MPLTNDEKWATLTDAERFAFLGISWEDLSSANEAVNLILDSIPEYGHRMAYAFGPPDDLPRHRALVETAVLRYRRPFSSNNVSRTKRGIHLPHRYMADFNASEKELHARLGEIRDRSVAHSDHDFVAFSTLGMRFKQSDEVEWSHQIFRQKNPRYHTTLSQIEQIPTLIQKIESAIEPELERFTATRYATWIKKP